MSYPDQITLSEYITARWKQLGVKHIFGCPGDFNLEVRRLSRPLLLSPADTPRIVLGLHREGPRARMGRRW